MHDSQSKSLLLAFVLLASTLADKANAASFGNAKAVRGHASNPGAARHASIAQSRTNLAAVGLIQIPEEEGTSGSNAVVDDAEVTSSSTSNFKLISRRRHHHKSRSPANDAIDQAEVVKRDDSSSGSCEYGTWQCVGLELQRCFDNSFQTLRTCPSGTVCSTDPSKTGCIWPFQADDTSSSASVSDDGSSASASVTADEVVAATGGMQGAVGVGVTSSVAPATSETTTSSSSAAVAASTSSVSGVQAAYAHGGHTSADDVTSSVTSTSTDTWWTASTSTSNPDTWDSAITASSSSWTDTWWTLSASSTSTSTPTSTSSTRRRHHSSTTSTADWNAVTASETQSVRVTASATSSGSVVLPVPTTGTTSSGTGAPHWVIYSDNWLSDMPTTEAVSGFNRFILSFLLTTGPADNAAFWESLSSADQIATVKAYNDAGVSVMVSAFGSTESPTTAGVDPTTCAQDVATFVISNNLNGVDIDYEDNTAFNNGQAEAWLITFQNELRSLLPSGEYLISHAPQAPWFDASSYSGGGYLAVDAGTNGNIDFYNIQFYNQGDIYLDCESLLNESGGYFPGTSIFEIAANGIALEKLVIGKPIDESAAANGYMDPATLAQCVTQAQAKSWNGGVMYWEYDSTAVSVMLTVSGGLVSGSVS